ncbi:MAG: 6-phosphogluconolactonase [Nitrospirae bacterium]|nr:MAG: 6-phosphogluconolactonase [Nitrospirota bacterium]
MARSFLIHSDPEALAEGAANHVVRAAGGAIEDHGCFRWVLAGGKTPRHLYTLLASAAFRSRIAWEHVHVFWGDERHVPPDHPDSNYRMARETLLAPLAIPDHHVYRIPAELPDAQAAADQYEATIREAFGLSPPAIPCFDLVLLGMGQDGHTASLFPGSPALQETRRLVLAPWVEHLRAYRITLTPPAFNHAKHILFLVAGADKALTLQAVFNGPYRPDRFPCQLIRPLNGQVTWLVDQAAASCL